MFRKPSDTNPPSTIATLQVPTKNSTIQHGSVASLIRLHNSREEEASAKYAAPPRIGTWQRSGTTNTTRDDSKSPASSHAPSRKQPLPESSKSSIAIQSWRANLAPRQPTTPDGHDTLACPSSIGTNAAQRHDPHEQSHHPPESFAAEHHEWPPPITTRTDPRSRRASSHRKPSITPEDRSWPRAALFEQPQSLERCESWMRRSLRTPGMQMESDESAPAITEPGISDWSLSRGAGRSCATGRNSSEHSRSSFADSRQVLFYGDTSPPHPPVPHVSPAVDRPNPWKRRDSSGSVVRSPSPQTRRELLSHRAFERVRSMSPPSIDEEFQIHNTSSRRPSDYSIATYITHKLSQHWSDAPAGTSTAPSAIMRVPPSTPSSKGHHIDSSLVQDILSSIDNVLAEHTTALQTVIKKSHQLLHEKEIICPSSPPHFCPQPESPLIQVLSPLEDEKLDSHGSASPKSPTLADPPKLLRRRTTSVPKLLKLIDATATNMGLPLTTKRDSLTFARDLANDSRVNIRKSNSDTDLPTQGDSLASLSALELRQPLSESGHPLETEARITPRTGRKASIPITPLRIKVSEETQPQPFLKIPYRVEIQATVREENTTCTTQRGHRLPTLAISTPSTASTSVSPLDPVQQLPLSAPSHTIALIPTEEVDDSHSSQPRIAPGDYLGSRTSSPGMFTDSNMPSPEDSSPLVMEYDRDAGLAERATRQSIFEIVPGTTRQTIINSMSTTTRQNSPQTPSIMPLESPDPTLIWRNASTIIPITPDVAMVPEPICTGDVEHPRLSRTRTRQVPDLTQERIWTPEESSSSHSPSPHSATPSHGIMASDCSEPQVPRTRTSSPMEVSEEVEGHQVPPNEPLYHPVEASMRSRPPMRSFIDNFPSPWPVPESGKESRQSVSESGIKGRKEYEKSTPDEGPTGQFWTTRNGAEMGRKWFGRHGAGEREAGQEDNSVR